MPLTKKKKKKKGKKHVKTCRLDITKMCQHFWTLCLYVVNECVELSRRHSGKDLPAHAGDIRSTGSIPGSGRSTGTGNSKPLQYFCLENSIDRGAWWTTIVGVTKNQTHSCLTHFGKNYETYLQKKKVQFCSVLFHRS